MVKLVNANNITGDSVAGRILLAMRPGRIEYSALWERFTQPGAYITDLIKLGLIERDGDAYALTEAGRAVCPNRRDVRPSPMHASESNMARKHGWSSANKAKAGAGAAR